MDMASNGCNGFVGDMIFDIVCYGFYRILLGINGIHSYK